MIDIEYKDRDTAIHRLNPFHKMAWVTGIFTLSLIFDNPVYNLLLFLTVLPLVAAARLWREWLSVIRYTVFLCLAIVLVNALVSYHGTTVLWRAGFTLPVIGTPAITLEAIAYGLGMSLRLLAIISACAVFSLTAHPDDIMLAVLKLRLPYKSALVTSLSTRFMPALIEDARRIGDVQRSRGLELDRGGPVRRIRNRAAILIPLLANSLDRAVQVAEAMEARAFGSVSRRSYFREIRLSKLDIIALAVIIVPVAVGVCLRCRGYGLYQYYPSLGTIGFDVFEGLMLALLLFLMTAIVPLAFLKKRLELD